MKKHPVVICSNLTNRYGFRVLASGIKLDAYTKNPIILYSHQRPNKENPNIMPVGKMHNVRLDSMGQLVGDMEFDQDDEFAVKLEKKWEKGMLNAVSLKAEVLNVSDDAMYKLPDQTLGTITESLLEEVSIEPVPGDSNAIALRLHYKGQPEQVVSLSGEDTFDPSTLFPTTKTDSDMKLIQLALSGHKTIQLAADANEEQLAKAISQLVKESNENAEKVVQLSADNENHKKTIDALNQKVESITLKAQEDKAEALVQSAVDAKKITPAEKAKYVELAKTNYDTVKSILDDKKGFTSVVDEAGKGGNGGVDYATLSYDELDKKNLLVKLKAENVELFKNKFKEKFGSEPKV